MLANRMKAMGKVIFKTSLLRNDSRSPFMRLPLAS